MRAVLLVVAVLSLAACSSSGTETPLATAAEQLAGEDAAAGQAYPSQFVADYVVPLRDLTQQCIQTDPIQLANMTDAVWNGLAAVGVTDEDRLSLLQHFVELIPAGSAPVDCSGVFAYYEDRRKGI